ncbi:T9SS type A sorting domain-containing protein [candidate division KSB1 bacterium]|nr:T9SS type A sorting domain-containing protein [candidate division KSB1 bacterium]
MRLDLGNSGITLDEGETEEKVLTIAAGVDHGQVTWQVQAPDTVSASKPISFTVIQFPKDVNTDAAASIEKKTVQMIVSTVDQGTIVLSNVRIHEPEGAKDGTLSTEQVFTIAADLAWNRADSVKARLLLPPGGFVPESLDDDLERVFAQTQGGTSPFWRIKAPTQALSRAVFTIDFTATDASNPLLKLGPKQDSLALKFVPRADLSFRVEVSNPEAARDRVVSVGQAFEITAVLENTGEAQVVGADSIRLLPLPEGYRLDGRENTFVKSSTAVGNQRRASWWIIAPNEKSKNPPGETFALRLQNLALDENTAQAARVDDRERQTTVLTEEKRLQVRKMELDRRPPAARGQDSLAVLCLELKNTGAGENSSNIMLRRVQLYVSMPDGAPLAPGTILRSLQIVAAENHRQVFGKLDVSPAMRANPIVLEFETPLLIGFETPTAVKVLASLTNTDSVEAFSIGFQSSTDLLAKDQDSDSLVAVEDGEGRTGTAFEISSGPAVLFNATFEEFYNYPNPLNHSQGTSFIYTLKQDSNVSLEIYTLLGELVWKKKYTSAEAQGKAGPHDGDIVWDGRNGNGKPVLNGVYLAVLKTNSGTVVTKVAVIK